MLRLKPEAASDCGLSREELSRLVASWSEAEMLLIKAAEAYDKAIHAAGFSTEQSQAAAGGVKGVLPITVRLIGPTVDNRAAKSGAQKMQDAESLLNQFGQALAQIDRSLNGHVNLEAPKQPLAMTDLLKLLTSGDVHLDTSTHPVIVGLYQAQLSLAPANKPKSGVFSETGPMGQRRGLITNTPRPLASLVSYGFHSVGGALGGHKRSDDRAMARDIAGDVCMADLLEFQRLTEQFEELRQWLLA
ncbi:hypothetical protein WJX84_003098 [Apatococcus fuscideae]